MTTNTQLKETPLYNDHLALGARMVPFGGWNMPLQYEGILAEHKHTREATTLFDTSHMGEFVIEGDYQQSGLDRLVTLRLSDLPVGACRYGLLLNKEGTILDDLIVFREEEQRWFIVVNGATTQKDKDHILAHLTPRAQFTDKSLEIGKIDVQGPTSRDVLRPLVPEIDRLSYYHFDYFSMLGERVLISRTGYTGELGYELYVPWAKTSAFWNELLKDCSVKPAGLGARDVLRLEMGYSLYGHELTEDINPLEAGLAKFVDFEKDFIGKEALLAVKAKGAARSLIGLVSDSRRTPREHYKIFSSEQEEIGSITSGSFSPMLNQGIGLGYIKSGQSAGQKNIFFGDDKIKISAMMTGRTFYKKGSAKS